MLQCPVVIDHRLGQQELYQAEVHSTVPFYEVPAINDCLSENSLHCHVICYCHLSLPALVSGTRSVGLTKQGFRVCTCNDNCNRSAAVSVDCTVHYPHVGIATCTPTKAAGLGMP